MSTCQGSLLAAADRRKANKVIAMVQLAAGIVIRAIVPAIAIFTATSALAQEIKLTRSAESGVEALLVDERSWDELQAAAHLGHDHEPTWQWQGDGRPERQHHRRKRAAIGKHGALRR